MAESGGILYVKGTDGTVKEVTLYTDVADVTDAYKEFKYNGNVVYASTTTDPDNEYATEFRYIDTDGVTRYLCTGTAAPMPSTGGTVVINGDLTTDLVVDGNLTVAGTISGNAAASGTITYGSLTGTATQGVTLTSCDISVEDGTLTFAADLSKDSGVFYTAGTVTNDSGTTTSIYSDLTIEANSQYALYNNNGAFFIESGAKISSTSTYTSAHTGCGVYNSGSGAVFRVNGELTASSVRTYGYGVYNSGGTFKVSGTLTAAEESMYGVYNNGTFTVENGGTVEAVGSGYGVYNSGGTFTVESGGAVEGTGSSYGVYNSQSGVLTVNGTFTAIVSGTVGYAVYSGSGTFTVNGTLYTVAPQDSKCITGTVITTDSGKVYLNGVLQ